MRNAASSNSTGLQFACSCTFGIYVSSRTEILFCELICFRMHRYERIWGQLSSAFQCNFLGSVRRFSALFIFSNISKAFLSYFLVLFATVRPLQYPGCSDSSLTLVFFETVQ